MYISAVLCRILCGKERAVMVIRCKNVEAGGGIVTVTLRSVVDWRMPWQVIGLKKTGAEPRPEGVRIDFFHFLQVLYTD